MTQLFSSDWVPLWTALAATAATVTVLVTAVYTYFTLRLVRAQAEPKVILYVKHDVERPSLLVIAIENIGRDIAHDVLFKPSRPIPAKGFGISPTEACEAQPMTEGPLISGIPALGPGDSRTITWGQFGGLSNAIGDQPIVVDYTYRHGRRRLNGQGKLEVLSYAGTDASEKPVLVMSRSLKEIAADIGRFTRSIESLVALEHEKSRKPDETGA